MELDLVNSLGTEGFRLAHIVVPMTRRAVVLPIEEAEEADRHEGVPWYDVFGRCVCSGFSQPDVIIVQKATIPGERIQVLILRQVTGPTRSGMASRFCSWLYSIQGDMGGRARCEAAAGRLLQV